MNTQKIRFIRNQSWLTLDSPSKPIPIQQTLPDWFRNADPYLLNPATGQHWQHPQLGSKIPSWRSCPALYDCMASGYAYRTPCDIEFFENSEGMIQGRVAEKRNEAFLSTRLPLDGFPAPQGHHDHHFAWWPDWSVELPQGYSALYVHPLNRFELPFCTMSGIVDNDKVNVPGTMPVFVRKGTSVRIPAGTVYAQIFPFKREHWESEVDASLSETEINRKNTASNTLLRQPDGGVYKNRIQDQRTYR